MRRTVALAGVALAVLFALVGFADATGDCTWIPGVKGKCIDIRKDKCGGMLRFPEKQTLKSYCVKADGTRDFNIQCCTGSVVTNFGDPELTPEQVDTQKKLLNGEYDKAAYDMTEGKFADEKLDSLFQAYNKKDGIDPKVMATCEGEPEAPGGDEMSCPKGLVPEFERARRIAISQTPVAANAAYPIGLQVRSRFSAPVFYSMFKKICKFEDSGDNQMPANVMEFFPHLYKSNVNHQSGVFGGGSNIYCAAASSIAFTAALRKHGYEINSGQGKDAIPKSFDLHLHDRVKGQALKPGDIISYTGSKTPRNGHVATVICSDPPGATEWPMNVWIVSGNTGPGGTIAVDRVTFVDYDHKFSPESHATWVAEALAKDADLRGATPLGPVNDATWKQFEDKKTAAAAAITQPQRGSAWLWDITRVSEYQPWRLAKIEDESKLRTEYNVLRIDSGAAGFVGDSLLVKTRGLGRCNVTQTVGKASVLKEGACVAKQHCAGTFVGNAGNCPHDDKSKALIGCCLPLNIKCGVSPSVPTPEGECFDPGNVGKTFCSEVHNGFTLTAETCTAANKAYKCCTPKKSEAANAEPAAPFLVDYAKAQGLFGADPKTCQSQAGVPGLCIAGSPHNKCPGKLLSNTKPCKSGTESCCVSAGQCSVAGQAGECISDAAAAEGLCTHRFGPQPSTACAEKFSCCIFNPSDESVKEAANDTPKESATDSPSASDSSSQSLQPV